MKLRNTLQASVVLIALALAAPSAVNAGLFGKGKKNNANTSQSSNSNKNNTNKNNDGTRGSTTEPVVIEKPGGGYQAGTETVRDGEKHGTLKLDPTIYETKGEAKDRAKAMTNGGFMDPNPPSGEGGTASGGGFESPIIPH